MLTTYRFKSVKLSSWSVCCVLIICFDEILGFSEEQEQLFVNAFISKKLWKRHTIFKDYCYQKVQSKKVKRLQKLHPGAFCLF